MRRVTMLIAAMVVLAGARASVAQAAVALVRGGAALATFERISADGCQIVSGELAVLEARTASENANGLYVVGVQEDICLGTGSGFAGYATGQFDVVGLLYARFRGSLVAESYSGGPPVTIELDLHWFGSGEVTRERSFFRDESQIAFTFSARRNAVTVGQFDVDGEAMPLTSATLARETNGQVTW